MHHWKRTEICYKAEQTSQGEFRPELFILNCNCGGLTPAGQQVLFKATQSHSPPEQDRRDKIQ